MPTDSPTARRRVFLVDDHVLLREMINRQPDIIVCGEAAGVDEALLAIAATRPDIVLVNLILAQGSGLELLKRLRNRRPRVLALVLSARDEADYGRWATRAGAREYLMKTQSLEAVLEGIRRVLAGELSYSDSFVSAFINSLAAKGKHNGDAMDRLSTRELQVYELIGAGLDSKEIVKRLNIVDKTTNAHVANLKLNLGLADMV